MKSLVGEAYITLSCLGGNYSFMISTNQNVTYIDNIKCQINESFFFLKIKELILIIR